MSTGDATVDEGGTASPGSVAMTFEVAVTGGGLHVEPATGDVAPSPAPTLDAVSAHDLSLFLSRIEPTVGDEFTRPVGVLEGDRRRIVELRASFERDLTWHLALGRELRTEQAPDHSEVVDSRLLELSTMVWITDADRLSRWFNDAWLRYVGLTLGELLGWGWMTCIHEDDLVGLLETYEAAEQDGRGFEYAVRVRNGDGQFSWTMTRAVPRFVHDEFAGFVGMCETFVPSDESEPLRRVTGLTGLLPSDVARGQAADVVERLSRLGESLDVVRPAEPVEAGLLRHLTSKWIAQHDAVRDRHDEIVLTVGEAAANAALHAYESAPGRIGLRCDLHDDHVTIRIRDWGRWREPTDERDSRGLVIMARLADQLGVNKRSDGTEIVLQFAFSS